MPHFEWLGHAKGGAEEPTLWMRVLFGLAIGWSVVLIMLGVFVLIP
jgi:hypothetical protein